MKLVPLPANHILAMHRQKVWLAISFGSLAALGCEVTGENEARPEMELAAVDSGESSGAAALSENAAEFTECLAQARTGTWSGDSIVLLEPTDDSAWVPLLGVVEENGHAVVDEFPNIRSLIIDVHEADTVFDWICWYQLSSETENLVSGAWANNTYRLAGGS